MKMNRKEKKITRREMLRRTAYAGTGVVAAPMLNMGSFRLFAGSNDKYSTRAIDLVKQSTVIDMLGILTLDFEKGNRWMLDPEKFTSEDFKAFKGSGINAIHPAIGIAGPQSFEVALQIFGLWNGFIASHPDMFMRIDSANDFKRLKASGKLGVILGVQNSDQFRKPDDVNLFHGIGQRVSQLTYNSRNMIGNGATERIDGGISDFGATIVERMNKVGMAIDVSHCGDKTTLDAFDISKKPVLITHSNVRALVGNHPRCKTDEAIKMVGKSGGVMGITAVRMFVKVDEPTTIEHCLNHFDHVRKLIGSEHLGVGSDIDLYGYDKMPPKLNKQLRAGYKGSYGFREKIDIEGLDHPKRMFDLTEGLIRRKYSNKEIKGILGGNFERVLKKIWTPEEAKKQS